MNLYLEENTIYCSFAQAMQVNLKVFLTYAFMYKRMFNGMGIYFALPAPQFGSVNLL